MGDGHFNISRATLDDLGELCALAKYSDVDPAYVERHLTDFQLAKNAEGSLAGALALEINGLHARLHSEMFTDFGVSDVIRAEFWNRIQSIAKSRGLTRLWTQETSLFWKHSGFAVAQAEMDSLPAAFQNPGSKEPWLTLQLRDEAALKKAVEKEFQRLKEEDVRVHGDSLKTIGLFKKLAIVLAVLVAIAGITLCVLILRNLPALVRYFHK